MIQINQLKLPIEHTREQLEKKIRHTLKLAGNQEFTYEILRQSIDARKKSEKKFVYNIAVETKKEKEILKKVSNKNIMSTYKHQYQPPKPGTRQMGSRPVIVGTGPAGLFCGYLLAKNGYRPILLERGEDVRSRQKSVEHFWNTGLLNPMSNVQFGEGGAGTFSDGKLNTLVKDNNGRNREVLKTFVRHGAPPEIVYQHKPHLGTDALIEIVESMRNQIIAWGGEFHFSSQVTDLSIEKEKLTSITINGSQTLDTEVLVLAIGHSARDTFEMLHERKLSMTAKSFAVGVRVEHPQEMINEALYGETYNPILKAAAYKLTARTRDDRGAYTFCMCPGGYVVNASSQPQALAVNGMSYSKRDSSNANSAVIVTVGENDFLSVHPLAGMKYQIQLEQAAYRCASGAVPVQLYEDFKNGIPSKQLGEIAPCIKGSWQLSNLRPVLPDFIGNGICDALEDFNHKIPGFARGDALLSGVESRTSSPVRILRDETLQSNIRGIYPCGEGAGYAGGITSAAMDGLKVAEIIISMYNLPVLC